MAGCRKKHSKLQQAHYKQYALENRAAVNRVKRLKKSLTNAITLESNNQIKTAIEKAHFRRKKPAQSLLTNDTKTRLSIIKFFTGKGDKNLISNTKGQHSQAWENLLTKKRNGKISANAARLKIMSIGENLPIEIKNQLEILKNNLRKAACT